MATINQIQTLSVIEWYTIKELSAREIADKLNIGLDAVYYCLRRNKVKRRTSTETNALRFERQPLSYTINELLSEEQKLLSILAVSLYWAEGAKRGHVVDFANSDVQMCKIFIRFLREICQIDESRLRGFIYCHNNQNPAHLVTFWSETLEIPESQFTKPYVRPAQASKMPHCMEHGLVHIRYSDKKLLRQIQAWIDEYSKNMGR